jgi:hypothetical protein
MRRFLLPFAVCAVLIQGCTTLPDETDTDNAGGTD